MKKIICVILAIFMLFLAACSDSGKLSHGTYYMEANGATHCRIYYRSESYFSILYGNTAERGTCTVDGGKLTLDISDSDCFYVFDIKDKKMIYNAESSSPSEEFVADGSVTDGAVFFLALEADR